jgi:cullin 3
MESGLKYMLNNDKIDDLTRMFQLFRRVDPDHRILTHGLTSHIELIGKEINAGFVSARGKEAESTEQGLPAALKWVEQVLDLKGKYDNILSEAFANEAKMKSCVVEGFSSFINDNSKSPEFISLFIDENLKKGIKGKTEQETDAILDNATVLFRHLRDKDVFERYYKSHLAKRLLQGRSVSDDAERGMLTKLRLEAGFAFTSKLEGMFKDMKVSRDLMLEYKKHILQSRMDDDTTPELSVSILTSTYWPLSFSSGGVIGKCIFPPIVEKAKSSFSQFYLGRHSGRQLSWHAGMVDLFKCLTTGKRGCSSDIQNEKARFKCQHLCYGHSHAFQQHQ